MTEDSGALTLAILVPLFVAVGLYLIWYSRRRKKMLEAFATNHHFLIRPEYQEELQKTLDASFSLQEKNLVRSFGQLSSLIDGDKVWIFRTVELLDLSPHSTAETTHFNRIVALFDVTAEYDEFFVLDKSMQAWPCLPGSRSPNPKVIEIVRQIATSCKAEHALSVTLTRKHGLIYFEPLVVGGETLSDVDSLYCIAQNLHEALIREASQE